MKTILKTGHEKILSLFYNDKSAKIHLRDIARRTKLNENSAFRFLDQIEKENILMSKKDGNLKKYELKKNELTYFIMSYFDIKRFNELLSLRRNAILYFLNKLEIKPVIVILFGSTAKDNYSKKSDIDLLLVVNSKINTKKAEEYVDSQTAIKIRCIQIEFNELKEEIKLKNDRVIQSAIKTGYPLTNHVEYYRLIFNERI